VGFILSVEGIKRKTETRCQLLMLVILVTWDAEIRRIETLVQIIQIVHKIPSPKITRAKRTGGVAQVLEHLLCK
jgi:hypothetical protein